MKTSIIIVFLFLSAFAKGQWYEGTLFYKNGTSEKGFIKYFDNARRDEIFFKSPDGKRKNIDSKKLKEIRFINDQAITITYVRLKPVTPGAPLFDFLTESSYTWFSLYYRGEFDVVTQETGILNQYIHLPGTDSAVRIKIDYHGSGNRLTLDAFHKAAIEIFKEKCSEMTRAIEDKKFLPKTIDELIEYYEKNCATVTASL